MKTDFWTLFNMKKDEVFRQFPATRRFLAQGFDLDPRHHRDNQLCLVSVNQTLRLDLASGEILE